MLNKVTFICLLQDPCSPPCQKCCSCGPASSYLFHFEASGSGRTANPRKTKTNKYYFCRLSPNAPKPVGAHCDTIKTICNPPTTLKEYKTVAILPKRSHRQKKAEERQDNLECSQMMRRNRSRRRQFAFLLANDKIR